MFLLFCISLLSSCFLFGSHDVLIGEFSSVTGSESSFGISNGRGVRMAIDEVNQSGGVHGRKIKLISLDTESSRERTIKVVNELIREHEVAALIGEVASDRSMAAAPLAQAAGVPMISPASTNPSITEVGNYIFRSCYIDPFQGFAMAKFASGDLNLTRIAIFRNHRSNYSSGLAGYFKETFERLGGKIVFEDSYSTGDSDFRGALRKLKRTRPEAIFLPGYFAEVKLIAEQIRKLGIKSLLLGGDGWDSHELIEDTARVLDNSYFTNHFTHEDKNPRAVEFVRKFKDRYGVLPDGVAAMGYDATHILLAAMQTAKELTSKQIREALAKTKGHEGVTGTISFNADRDPVKPIVILRIKDKAVKFVKRIEP